MYAGFEIISRTSNSVNTHSASACVKFLNPATLTLKRNWRPQDANCKVGDSCCIVFERKKGGRSCRFCCLRFVGCQVSKFQIKSIHPSPSHDNPLP